MEIKEIGVRKTIEKINWTKSCDDHKIDKSLGRLTGKKEKRLKWKREHHYWPYGNEKDFKGIILAIVYKHIR